MKKRLLEFHKKPKLNLSCLESTYFVYYFSDVNNSFVEGDKIKHLHFMNGKLLVDQLPIKEPQFNSRTVSWSQQTEHHYTAGQLNFSLNGVDCQGTIAVGSKPEDSVMYHVFASLVPASVYTTSITKQRFPAGTNPDSVPADQWQPGPELQLGYNYQPGQAMPTPVVQLDNQPVTDYVGYNIVQGDSLEVVLTMETAADILCSVDENLYLAGSIVFSSFGEKFTGTIRSTCKDRNGDGTYLWKGQTVNRIAPVYNVLMASNADAVLIKDGIGLSLGELLSLVPDTDVGETAHEMLVENMKWAIAQDSNKKAWLQTFFNQQPPVLPKGRADLISQDMAWYQDDYAISYLSWAFDSITGPGAPCIKLDPQQKSKLEYHLKEGIGKSISYNKQMNGIYVGALLQAKPRLSLYISDGREKWAKSLYDFITSPAQLSLLVNRVYANNDISSSNNLATLLQVLEPEGNYAQQYQKRVLARVLMQASMTTVINDADFTASWLADVLQVFAQAYGTKEGNSPNGEPDDKQEVADAVRDAAEYFGSFSDLARELASFLITAKGSTIAQQSQSAQEAFAAAYPKLATAGRVLFLVCWVGGVFNVVVSFLGWSSISTEKRIGVITSAVDLVCKAADLITDILKSSISAKALTQINNWASSPDVLDATVQIFAEAEEDWVGVGAEATVQLFNDETRVIEAQGSRWAKIFSGVSKVVAVVAVVVSAVFTVLSTIEFINAIKDGKPLSTEILDGIQMVSNTVTTVCLVLDLVLDMTVFALAASVFAIIGLIVTIISMFMPEPKEEQPVNKFMQNTALPFINQLEALPV